MKPRQEFFNLFNHDFARTAVAVPAVRVADPDFNARQTLALVREAAGRQVAVVVFPELGLSAYSCEDLFQQRALLDTCDAALAELVRATAELPVLAVVGAPLVLEHQLFNCAVLVGGGRIYGVVPKTYVPNYREFYEVRQFRSGDVALRDEIDVGGQRGVPFGPRLLFEVEEQPLLRLHVEICEDLWVPTPPSSYAALAGATVLLNLSASNVTVAKADYRHQLVASQSARCLAAYL
jgi:NAD+ synthase (glutamine-hydrolysing)